MWAFFRRSEGRVGLLIGFHVVFPSGPILPWYSSVPVGASFVFHLDSKTKGVLYPVKMDVYVNGEYQDTKKTTRFIQVGVGVSVHG